MVVLNKISAGLEKLLASPIFGLSFLAGMSAFVYAWAFVRPAFLPAIYPHATPDLFKLYNAGSQVHISWILGFVILAAMYALAYRLAQQAQGRAGWVVVLGGSLAFGAILMQLFPVDAADIFDYIIHGRMTAIYGDNPYLHRPKEYPSDPFYQYVAWKNDPSPYGPLWEHLAALAARLAGEDIVAGVWAYKLATGLFWLGSIVLAAEILRRTKPAWALAGVVLLAWNPPALYAVWGNGHNDAVMVFFVVAAVWAMRRRRFTLAALALTGGALVKFLPALLLPVVGLIALHELDGRRARLGYVLRTGLACLALAALVYAPFWEGSQVLTVLDRDGLFTSTIPASLYYILAPHVGAEAARAGVSRAALLVTLAFVLWQALRSRRAAGQPWQRFVQAGFAILAFYLMVTILWFQPWYLVWLIGLAPLLPSRNARLLAIVFGFAALSKQLVAGPLLFIPTYRFPQPWLEILFTVGVLGPPWLVWLWQRTRPVLARARGRTSTSARTRRS